MFNSCLSSSIRVYYLQFVFIINPWSISFSDFAVICCCSRLFPSLGENWRQNAIGIIGDLVQHFHQKTTVWYVLQKIYFINLSLEIISFKICNNQIWTILAANSANFKQPSLANCGTFDILGTRLFQYYSKKGGCVLACKREYWLRCRNLRFY